MLLDMPLSSIHPPLMHEASNPNYHADYILEKRNPELSEKNANWYLNFLSDSKIKFYKLHGETKIKAEIDT